MAPRRAATADEPYDAIIVGAGPVGAVGALQLARAGMRVAVVEATRSPAHPFQRVMHMDAHAVAVVHTALAEDATHVAFARGLATGYYADMDRWSRGEPFATADSSTARWVAFFDQPQLEGALRRALAKHPKIDALFGMSAVSMWSAKDGTPRLVARDDTTGKSRELRASYLLGCDGANSVVREQLGAELQRLGESATFLVVDAHVPMDALYGASGAVYHILGRQRFTTFVISGGGDHVRWQFLVEPDEDVLELQAPERVREMIEPFVLAERLDDVKLLRHSVYRYDAVLAPRLRYGRVFLCGDAAHRALPTHWHGLGAGVRNVHSLCRKLALVWSAASTDALLDKYEPECWPSMRAAVAESVALGRLLWGSRMLAGPALGMASALQAVRGGHPLDVTASFLPRVSVMPGCEGRVPAAVLRAWALARVRFADRADSKPYLQLVNPVRPKLVAWGELPKAAALKLLHTLPVHARPQIVLVHRPDQRDRPLSLMRDATEEIIYVSLDDWRVADALFGKNADLTTTLIVMEFGMHVGRYASTEASALCEDYLAALKIAGPVAF